MTLDDFTTTIPVFPLEGALLLPSGLLPLNIFEQKYISMVNAALESDRLIGMIQPDQSARQAGQEGAIQSIGCVGRITQFSETEDGRYLIMLKGLMRYKVVEEIKTKCPYRIIKVDYADYVDDLVEDCDTIEIDRESFLPKLNDYLNAYHIDTDWEIIEQTPCETLLTTLPMVCPFDSQEKQLLLEASDLEKRFEILQTLIEIALKSGSSVQSATH
jgi:Lon protease-like protein